MPINTQELLSAVAVLTDKQSMRVTLKSSAKGAAVAGSSTFLGGLVAGPIGLFLGGAVGGLVAYAMTNNQFKPVSHVIMHDLSVREQEQLKQRIVDALSRFQPTDLVAIASLLAGNMAAQQTVITAVVSFLTNEMRMQIIDWSQMLDGDEDATAGSLGWCLWYTGKKGNIIHN